MGRRKTDKQRGNHLYRAEWPRLPSICKKEKYITSILEHPVYHELFWSEEYIL